MLVTCHAIEIGVADVDVDIDTDLQVNFVVFFVPLAVFICDYLVNAIMIESGWFSEICYKQFKLFRQYSMLAQLSIWKWGQMVLDGIILEL